MLAPNRILSLFPHSLEGKLVSHISIQDQKMFVISYVIQDDCGLEAEPLEEEETSPF
ncbi:hypothetical protein Ddye_011042 [Dipteronia dyeriana]|uniref:Uncharacterized protein n=1 Tax=Dipteronia dyeriana TaxID=168575 RepID=A0AAD9XED4_9ROSI|nr:hypothetical protein Ddye_011042 [Dipteronia dyeriana]